MNAKEVMTRYWDGRARENAFHFIASTVVGYDQQDSEAFFASGEEEVQRFLQEVNYTPQPDATMLEIGCGNGRMTRAFASRFGKVYGIDISQEMITQGQQYLAECQNVHLSVCSGTDLHDFANASMDFCFSYIVFQHIPDPAIIVRYIHEICRVLKPGGTAYFQLSTVPPLLARVRHGLRLRTRMRALLRMLRHRGTTGPDYESPAWLGSSLSARTLRQTIEDAGLKQKRLRGEGTLYTWVLCQR
jgi:ubiquinone/menaquinone biosynthesis C-methylase UbiE